MDSRILDNAIEYIKTLFADDCSGHDVFHTLRVYRTASAIAREEGADLLTVGLAALLHDADDRKLSPQTSQTKARAAAFLASQNLPEDMVRAVLHIIAQVSFAGTDSVVPDSLEGQCVQDADRLDAIGAIGIARTFAYGGSRGQAIHDPQILPQLGMDAETYARHQSTSVNHFHEKLFLLKDMMNTRAAKQLADRRDRFMHEFLEEFTAEWEGMR